MTLRTRLNAFVRRWVKPTPSEAAAVLSRHARDIKSKSEALHERLRAELAAGYVRGVKVR